MIRAINKNMPDLFASNSDAGHFSQFLLHHPFKINPQPAVDDKYVILTLMIRDNDVRLSLYNVLPSFNINKHGRQAAIEPRPDGSAHKAGCPGISQKSHEYR